MFIEGFGSLELHKYVTNSYHMHHGIKTLSRKIRINYITISMQAVCNFISNEESL